MNNQQSGQSILAVDDSDIIINLIQILLENEGYQFQSADSAYAAMELIKQHDFDLILMDIEMPGVSGIELLEEIGQLGLLKKTKVIMLTGKTDVEHVKQCLGLGASGYILKPFDHTAMVNRIGEVLQSS